MTFQCRWLKLRLCKFQGKFDYEFGNCFVILSDCFVREKKKTAINQEGEHNGLTICEINCCGYSVPLESDCLTYSECTMKERRG